MNLLFCFIKPTFWTQFLFGIVAIFAVSEVAHCESKGGKVAEQQVLNVVQQIKQAEVEQIFLQQSQFEQFMPHKQAVEICTFFAKLYRLERHANPPIRAGPIV